METTKIKYRFLAPKPKSAYKQLFVKGTRIRARILYGQCVGEEARTAEEVAEAFRIPVEAVRECIAYCEDNPRELVEDYAREERLADALGMNDPDYKFHGKPRVLSPQERARIMRSMNIYLDDDSADTLLARLLQQAGHDVQVPADAALSGSDDAVHLKHTIRVDRILLTGNHDDFENLHELIIQAQGHHPGILVIRHDNHPSRDMKPGHVVRANRNLLAAAVPLNDSFYVLNHWR